MVVEPWKKEKNSINFYFSSVFSRKNLHLWFIDSNTEGNIMNPEASEFFLGEGVKMKIQMINYCHPMWLFLK